MIGRDQTLHLALQPLLALVVLATPSRPAPGEYLVPVAPLNVALAQRLGISEGAVRRLVNPDHASRLDGVVLALAAMGHRLIVEAQRAA